MSLTTGSVDALGSRRCDDDAVAGPRRRKDRRGPADMSLTTGSADV
jgi:hypothetical protein